ncbi:MAG: tetratricopeptide repeat protein [Fimbriimonadaceae bacterium]|nr:tetratricopeptide repeat protein [Fimbriimonadaceae bacterium]
MNASNNADPAVADALRLLQRSLQRAAGFVLLVAVHNVPAERARFRAMLQTALAPGAAHEVILPPGCIGVLNEILAQVPEPQGPVLVDGFDQCLRSDDPQQLLCFNLNLQRPLFSQRLGRPVVFWLPEYAANLLARHAPDFYAIRSVTVPFPELATGQLERVDQYLWQPTVDANLTAAQRRARIAELHERLADQVPEPSLTERIIRARWQHQLGRHCAALGAWDEALERLDAAREGFLECGVAGEAAVALGDLARLRADRGEVDAALALFEKQLAVSEQAGDLRERGCAIGGIARLRSSRGEKDAAMALYAEQLRVFEQIGDERARAVTLGDIAHLRADRGDTDEALRLHRESRKIYEQIGDGRALAVTLGHIARIMAGRREADAALALQRDKLAIAERLGDARSRAICLGDIGSLLAARGEVDAAMALHEEALAVFRQLGDVRSRAVSTAKIARLRADRGEFDIALALHQEQYRAVAEIGDPDGQAEACWDLAQLHLRRSEPSLAAPLAATSYRLLERTGRLDGLSVVGVLHGQLLWSAGQPDEALAVLTRSREGFRQLQREADAQRVEALINELQAGR